MSTIQKHRFRGKPADPCWIVRSPAEGHSQGDDRIAVLRQAAEDGHAPAIYELAMQSVNTFQKKQWLREAAHEGYVPAIYEFALSCSDPAQRRRWFRKAADEGHLEALYRLALETGDPVEQRSLLRAAAGEGHVPAIHELARLADDPRERCQWLFETGRNATPHNLQGYQ